MNMTVRCSLAFLGVCTLLGCGEEEPVAPLEDAAHRGLYYVVTPSKKKGGWGCRDCDFTNSPHLGTYAFDRLGYGDTPYAGEPRLVEARDPQGNAWPVSVDTWGLEVRKNGAELRGLDLLGWDLVVKDPQGTVYDVHIYNYEEVEGWNDGADAVPTYGLSQYDPALDGHVNVCPGLSLDDTSIVFLNREIYGANDMKVTEDIDGVATLACRGHALAKMKLLQYDPDSPHLGTRLEDRQATLRMITADYCGTGTPHTQSGVPLHWTDALGHVQFDSGSMSPIIEAEWDEFGAVCLNDTRLPGVTVDCSPAPNPPPCDPEFSGYSGGTVWVSLLP